VKSTSLQAETAEQNRKKAILAGVLLTIVLGCAIYAYNALVGFGSSAPPPPPAAPRPTQTVSTATTSVEAPPPTTGLGVAPGVAARKMASTSSSLDPTLDEAAMLRTESLVYSGSGRNIFSATYTPPAPLALPKTPPPRPTAAVYIPPVPTGPPPPPPINLKYFGTAVRANGDRQAFLLSGEDVYLAAQGDIVARKYKIVSIAPRSIQVEDLTNRNTQTLPLQAN
jgi:hypothetical protein